LGELLKQSDINDLMEYRVMLETEIAALAAARATGDDIALLSGFIENMRMCRGEIELLTKYDACFHIQLSAASQNLLLQNTMNVVRSVYETVISQAFHKDKSIVCRAIDFHSRILQAVKDRDTLRARETTHEHIMDVMHVIRIGPAAEKHNRV
jgi:DNA-binding FadR family transcriptional regulator